MKITIEIDERQTAALERMNAEYQTEVQPTLEEFTNSFLQEALNRCVSECREQDVQRAAEKLRSASDEDVAAVSAVLNK